MKTRTSKNNTERNDSRNTKPGNAYSTRGMSVRTSIKVGMDLAQACATGKHYPEVSLNHNESIMRSKTVTL